MPRGRSSRLLRLHLGLESRGRHSVVDRDVHVHGHRGLHQVAPGARSGAVRSGPGRPLSPDEGGHCCRGWSRDPHRGRLVLHRIPHRRRSRAGGRGRSAGPPRPPVVAKRTGAGADRDTQWGGTSGGRRLPGDRRQSGRPYCRRRTRRAGSSIGRHQVADRARSSRGRVPPRPGGAPPERPGSSRTSP